MPIEILSILIGISESEFAEAGLALSLDGRFFA
jgi:hypothetical protein